MIINSLNNLRNKSKVKLLLQSKNGMFSYFTIWIFLLQILCYLGLLKNYQFSILILTSLVYIGGFFIVYIKPKYLYIKDIDLKIEGTFLRLFDILYHHIPLVIFLYNYKSDKKPDSGYFCLLIILIYVLVINPFKKYSLK